MPRRTLTRRTLTRLAAAGLLVAASAGAAAPSAPSAPDVALSACLTGVGPYPGSTPWPQKLFDTDNLRAIGDGKGQLVAVLGSGVDINNGQFAPGQIVTGHNLLPDGVDPHTDCDGRGTFAAGLIGAQPVSSTRFAGLAPGVTIDPIRYVQTFEDDNSAAPDPALLTQAIDAAVEDHARVILVVVPAAVDDAGLKAATARAVAADIVVVSPAAGADPGSQTYPTAYPGVLGVGAIDINGAVAQAETGPQIGLTAPGKGLISTAPGSDIDNTKSTDVPSMSAAFAAGAAALVRAANPSLHAAQVITRLELTADRAAPTERTDDKGWGTVNPYAALTTDLAATAALPTGPAQPSASRIEAQPGPVPPREHSRSAALIAVGVLVLSLLVAAGAAATRTARERRRRDAEVTEQEPASPR